MDRTENLVSLGCRAGPITDTQWVSRGTWGPHGFGGKGHTLACVYSPKISQAWACPDLEPRRPLFPATSPNMHLNFSTRCSSASRPLSPGSELPAQGDQATPISASPAPKTGPGFKRCPINAGSAHSPVTPTPGILQHFLCLFELVAFLLLEIKRAGNEITPKRLSDDHAQLTQTGQITAPSYLAACSNCRFSRLSHYEEMIEIINLNIQKHRGNLKELIEPCTPVKCHFLAESR